jgi:hypothetical protein
VRDGAVDATTVRLLSELSRRDGWFVPAHQLLDYLAEQRPDFSLPRSEWRWMQWRWAWDIAMGKLRSAVR